MQKIFTEDPNHEQWQMLSNFMYPANVERFFEESGTENHDKQLLELVSNSILQAQEYFYAASVVSLNISPLLLYYGTINLMFSASVLMLKRNVEIKNHGIKVELDGNSLNRLADIEITPYFSTQDGGLFQFCTAFCPEHNVLHYGSQSRWTLLEILGSIPELKRDFEDCYNTQSHIIPIQVVKSQKDYVERVDKSEFRDLDIISDLKKIVNFDKNYFNPRLTSDYVNYPYVILRRKIGGEQLTEYSVFGQAFLQRSHAKQSHLISLPNIIYMYMGLFTLSYLSRYKPAIWSSFVKSDSTGEKRVIEKFLKICKRALPNFILNSIYSVNFCFVNEIIEPLDLSRELTEERVRELFREELKKFRKEVFNDNLENC